MQKYINETDLYSFLKRASNLTYAGNGDEVEAERPGFRELTYEEGDLSYRDSYTGHFKSRGMEVVRYKGVPIWTSMYGGGMVNGKEEYANVTFEFLKKAFKAKEDGFISLRGPHDFSEGEWKYIYTQEGSIDEFWGYEEIFYNNILYFYHRIIGGEIVNG